MLNRRYMVYFHHLHQMIKTVNIAYNTLYDCGTYFFPVLLYLIRTQLLVDQVKHYFIFRELIRIINLDFSFVALLAEINGPDAIHHLVEIMNGDHYIIIAAHITQQDYKQRSWNFTNSLAICAFSSSLQKGNFSVMNTSPGIPNICSSMRVSSSSKKLIRLLEINYNFKK